MSLYDNKSPVAAVLTWNAIWHLLDSSFVYAISVRISVNRFAPLLPAID